MAKELAEARRCAWCCSRRARTTTPRTFTARPRDMLPRLYRDAAQHATIGRPPILLPLGKAVGGTTLVNSGTCFRTPDHVLARWRDEFGLEDLTPEALAPHFERVEATLNVVPVPPELAGAQRARRQARRRALGWSGDFVRRNARGCVGSGVCAFGCPANAKQHVGVSYIPQAPRRRRHHLHRRDRAPARARRRGVHDRRRAPARRRAQDRRRRRRDPHAAAARAQRPRRPAARPQPLAPPRHRGVGADGRAGRHGARRPAVLLRRRVRERGDHARGHRRPARLRRAWACPWPASATAS